MNDEQLSFLENPKNEFERAAAKHEAERRAKPKPARSIQVPLWPEPERMTANVLLRSALFGSARRGRFVEDAKLASWGNTDISFTGLQLTQFDETVWLQLVHLHRGQQVGEHQSIHTSAKALLREIGVTPGGSGIRRLKRSINSLMSAVVTFRRGPELLKLGGPVRRFYLHEETGRYSVSLNPDFIALLHENSTRLHWETRKALPTGITTWLHRYSLSHRATKKQPHRIGLSRLHALTGMTSSPKEFKRTLKQAMERLVHVDVVASWTITPNEALEFVRPPSRSMRSKKES